MRTEKAILAGGCFWGMEELFRAFPGVESTRVGYTGGTVVNPTYEKHTGHAEALEVVFNPEKLLFRKLLEFFFKIHDPTTKNRQGNDIGDSYRSAIFYLDEEQKRTAMEVIQAATASKKWPGPIVTQVVPAKIFYEAETYHQKYLARYPDGYTCHFIRPSWSL